MQLPLQQRARLCDEPFFVCRSQALGVLVLRMMVPGTLPFPMTGTKLAVIAAVPRMPIMDPSNLALVGVSKKPGEVVILLWDAYGDEELLAVLTEFAEHSKVYAPDYPLDDRLAV